LHAGDDDDGLRHPLWSRIGGLALPAGAALSLLPAFNGLPVAGYLAVALLLCGAVLLMPAIAGLLLPPVRVSSSVPLALGLARLRATPRHVAIGVAAILVSFSLVAAMLIMVLSFRQSLDAWLGQVLPADLYVRAAASGETAVFPPEKQSRIAETAGVASVSFTRLQSVIVDPDRPSLTIIARDLPQDAHRALPLLGSPAVLAPGAAPPVWISEIAAALHGWRAGQAITLPLGHRAARFTVAGIWRDYARQNGAVIIDRARYAKLTADHDANDAAIRLAPGAERPSVERSLRTALGPDSGAVISGASDIRRLSMGIFDRTFAITWALEAAALIVGLFGISIAFGVQALSRRREFGMLRHVGMTRSQVALMLAGEGALTAGIGTACGLVLGSAIGVVLIEVINRQSFHWSMQLHMPWPQLLLLSAVIMACAVATAVISGRGVMQAGVISAVREDW
jgi:putative ABC transport system permease protein